jgi:flagellar hook-associated protein 2
VSYYKEQATISQDSSGNDTSGVLAGDTTAKSIMSQVRNALLGTASGISSSAAYKSAESIGLKISSSGTLSLDESKLKEALKEDPEAVSKLFSFSGTTTNESVSFSSASSTTATGGMDFSLTYGSGGAVTGTLTYGGTTYDVSGTDGTIQGPTGSPLEGLSLKVTGSGSGTMTLSRGVGQKLQDVISNLTSYSGIIENTRTSLDEQNKTLSTRIDSAQALLDKKEATLKEQFDLMESTIAELKSLSSYFSS